MLAPVCKRATVQRARNRFRRFDSVMVSRASHIYRLKIRLRSPEPWRNSPIVRLLLATISFAALASAQGHAEYVGGTAAKVDSGTSGSIDVSDPHYFAFYAKKTQV